ncbi:hypothetical protein Tco_0015842 [Tanacetum coccineum]
MAELKDGTPKNTNKRKANAIPAMIPTNIALLVDLPIRKIGRPVTRQPMTQDMHNDILNRKTGRPVTRQPMTQGAIYPKQNTLYPGNSTLLPSDKQNLKGKRVTRQSLRRINSTQPQRKADKIGHRDGFVGLSKGYCYGMPRLLKEQPMPWTIHIQFVVVEVGEARCYNSMFAFTYMGGKVDDTVNYGRGPFCYRIHDNEISNRIKAVSVTPRQGGNTRRNFMGIITTQWCQQ